MVYAFNAILANIQRHMMMMYQSVPRALLGHTPLLQGRLHALYVQVAHIHRKRKLLTVDHAHHKNIPPPWVQYHWKYVYHAHQANVLFQVNTAPVAMAHRETAFSARILNWPAPISMQEMK